MNVADTLRAAKQVIAAHGWRQGPGDVTEASAHLFPGLPIGPRPGACAFDAIGRVNAPDSTRIEAGRLLETAMGFPNATARCTEAVAWNDKPGRTVDDVNAVYDKAIEIAEGQR